MSDRMNEGVDGDDQGETWKVHKLSMWSLKGNKEVILRTDDTRVSYK